MLSYLTLHYRSSVERVDACNRQVVYDEVGETRYACPHNYVYILVLHDQIDLKDSFQKLSLIRSKIFENAVSPTHYEIKTRNFIHSYISLSLVCTKSFEVM